MAAPSNAAHLLLAALKASPPKSHPPKPFHMGRPQPKIGARAYVVAALWLADRAARFVEPRDKFTFDDFVQSARKQLELGPDDHSQQNELFEGLRFRSSRMPCKIGAWAAHEAANWVFRPIYAGGAARPAAANHAKLVAKHSPSELPKFLLDLDALCVHLELLTILDGRGEKPSASIAATLWRGHEEGKVTQ